MNEDAYNLKDNTSVTTLCVVHVIFLKVPQIGYSYLRST